MRALNTYWVKVNGKMVPKTGSELVELYRNEVERNEHSAENNDTAVKEALIGQIGGLYQRNKSLTKGHATLTRRVQELEAQLAEAQQAYEKPKHINCRTHVRGITEQEHIVLSKAQHDLQQFVTEEVKRQIINATKIGGILNGR